MSSNSSRAAACQPRLCSQGQLPSVNYRLHAAVSDQANDKQRLPCFFENCCSFRDAGWCYVAVATDFKGWRRGEEPSSASLKLWLDGLFINITNLCPRAAETFYKTEVMGTLHVVLHPNAVDQYRQQPLAKQTSSAPSGGPLPPKHRN